MVMDLEMASTFVVACFALFLGSRLKPKVNVVFRVDGYCSSAISSLCEERNVTLTEMTRKDSPSLREKVTRKGRRDKRTN